MNKLIHENLGIEETVLSSALYNYAYGRKQNINKGDKLHLLLN